MVSSKPSPKPRAAKKDNLKASSVRTVHVAAKVLDALAEYREPVRITELARKLKMTMPRISRHVSTLRELGFVEKAEPLETYRLGVKLFNLGQAAVYQNSLVNIAQLHLDWLRSKLKQTVLLSADSSTGASVLFCLDSGEATTIIVRPGTFLSFPQSPTARLFRAFRNGANSLSPAVIDDEELSETDGMSRKQLEARLQHIYQYYFDYSADVRNNAMGSIAAPIFNHENRMVGAVTVVLPSSAITHPPETEMVSAVKMCARKISASLGSKVWEQL